MGTAPALAASAVLFMHPSGVMVLEMMVLTPLLEVTSCSGEGYLSSSGSRNIGLYSSL